MPNLRTTKTKQRKAKVTRAKTPPKGTPKPKAQRGQAKTQKKRKAPKRASSGAEKRSDVRRAVKPSDLIIGGVYAYFDEEEQTYGLLKITACSRGVVHVRFYDRAYKKVPAVAPKTAKLDWFIGHVPLPAASFHELRPTLLTKERVTSDEREGFDFWLNGA